ncbi:MAG: glycoside hydrolase family 3 C-terminal domain-containing protein [Clostridiales bacterium]|nr:glycoside hydrolase family 3 C-terminal domain-containing protein [Clostridiales bacterium]
MKDCDIKNLTAEEKIKLVMGKNWWESHDLGGKVPSFRVSDGPVGLRCLENCDEWTNDSLRPSVAYPSYQMLAQSWDKSLAYEYGAAVADDCMDMGVDIILGPGCNIKRTPRCGRNFEYFSEDPYLAGVFAKSFIEGAQESGIGVALKHYCCNNLETVRRWRSSDLDERTLREIYLKPFEIACEAKPWTVMSSYNLVNGVRMAENGALFTLLREEFGFNGMIMSDWEVVQDTEVSLEAGLDWEMPYCEAHEREREQLLKEGKIDLNALDECAGRVLALAQKVSEHKKTRKARRTVEERIALAQKVEEEAIVLLKNNGVLPLQSGKICVTGAPVRSYYYGGGSSAVVPNRPYVSLDEALKRSGVDAVYVDTITNFCMFEHLPKALQACKECDVTVFCVGTGNNVETEAKDRADISLIPEELEALRYLRKYSKKLIVVVYAGSAVDLKEVDALADGVLLAGFGGQCVSQAVANVLTGKVNPSGRLSETYANCLEDIPAEHAPKDEYHVKYAEGLNVGYRYFSSRGIGVLYPFGYGLSYTQFTYRDLKVMTEGAQVRVSVKVKNAGAVKGKEVIQLYAQELSPKVERPLRELRAFEKIELNAGEEKEVVFMLNKSELSYYSVEKKAWVFEAGNYIFEIGRNARDIALSQEMKLN